MTLSSLTPQNMSFLSSSLSSSSLSSPNNSPIHTRPVQPTCLPIFYTRILYAAILTNPILMRKAEEMSLFIEDTISQELIRLFHDTTMAQNFHFLSAPSDLPAEYGVPLRLTCLHPQTYLISSSPSQFSYFHSSYFPHSHLPHLSSYRFHYVHGRKRPLHHLSQITSPSSRLSPFDDSPSILLYEHLHHQTPHPDVLSSPLGNIRNPYGS